MTSHDYDEWYDAQDAESGESDDELEATRLQDLDEVMAGLMDEWAADRQAQAEHQEWLDTLDSLHSENLEDYPW